MKDGERLQLSFQEDIFVARMKDSLDDLFKLVRMKDHSGLFHIHYAQIINKELEKLSTYKGIDVN